MRRLLVTLVVVGSGAIACAYGRCALPGHPDACGAGFDPKCCLGPCAPVYDAGPGGDDAAAARRGEAR